MRITMLSKFKAVLHYPDNNNIRDNNNSNNKKYTKTPQEVNQLSYDKCNCDYLTANIKKRKKFDFSKENGVWFIKY